MLSMVSFAQIPTRSIINTGFEQPPLGCTNCYNLFPVASVPGWKTTDPTGVIEIWGNNFQGKVSHSGSQFAEINANTSAFLYQTICVAPNESISYSIWYLKRTSSVEQMRAQLTEPNNTIVSQSPIFTATNTWTNYVGTLTNNAVGGSKRIGFVAVSGGSTGNLIDDITISIRPVISFRGFQPSAQNEGNQTKLILLVNGTLTSSATVSLAFSGTANYPADFSIGLPSRGSLAVFSGSIVLTLPAGDYDPNQLTGPTSGVITIPITALNDLIIEPNELITYSIDAVSGGGSNALVFNLNGYGADCMNYVGSATDTIKNLSALPIELSSFTVSRVHDFADLRWTTISESNNDYFSLFRSNDGLTWQELTQISGSGTTTAARNYRYLDMSPLNGLSYYLLQQTDYDGTIKRFPPIYFKFEAVLIENWWVRWTLLGQRKK